MRFSFSVVALERWSAKVIRTLVRIKVYVELQHWTKLAKINI